MLSPWSIRPYRSDDLTAVVDLLRARAEAYGSEALLSRDEVLWRMQGPGGSRPMPAVVVDDPDVEGVKQGALLGAGAFSREGTPEHGPRSYILRFWGHPAAVEMGVERAIVERLLQLIRDEE